METIRILIYTDYCNINESCDSDFGVFELENLIRYKTKSLAHVQFGFLNRHGDCPANENQHAANKLTSELLAKYDELWVFSYLQSNLPAEPDNELGNDEVAALFDWMKSGGVLIAGDHAMPDTRILSADQRRKDHRTYLNLGRALGHRVPRAGQLRVWEGPPTKDYNNDDPPEKRDNYNTVVGPDPSKLDEGDGDGLKLQSDDIAQELILVMQPLPHRLFWWYVNESHNVVPIDKFPDHQHEGKLKVPDYLDGEWPGPTPFPTILAKGTDKRFPDNSKIYDMVMAYDGDGNHVGRIVADSTWHHYFNVNLKGFKRDICGNPIPLSTLDQIAQYYANLVFWLAPKTIRENINFNLFFELARNGLVREIEGSAPAFLGRTARFILESRIGVSNLYRFFASSNFEAEPSVLHQLLSLVFLGRGTIGGSDLINLPVNVQEFVLGSVIKDYHDDFRAKGISDPGRLKTDSTPPLLLIERLISAFLSQSDFIESLSDELRKELLSPLGQIGAKEAQERSDEN